MPEEITKLIEELKEIVLYLHRSAGNLDEVIQNIENGKNRSGDLSTFIGVYRQYRVTCKTLHYSNLDKRENDIWQKIVNTIKEEGLK